MENLKEIINTNLSNNYEKIFWQSKLFQNAEFENSPSRASLIVIILFQIISLIVLSTARIEVLITLGTAYNDFFANVYWQELFLW